MERIVLLFAVFLLCEAKDTMTEIPVFVRTGGDMFLNLKPPIPLEDGEFIWKFNDNQNIVKFKNGGAAKIHKIYQGRAEFSKQNYSLILRNVTKSNSGRYVALVSGDEDTTVAEFNVKVQDPVAPVMLAVKSTGSCNLTVTCSPVDSDFSSTAICDNQTCSQVRGQESKATTDPSSVNIYLEEGFIICNHSNHVSWEHKKRDIKPFCGLHSGKIKR
ncbi:T-lymphocyte surface antigen Ly-9-like [Chaetodon trifascialis]|uniref:T-lymphocyte surface antigen Ly-9-like n=1 Tax=Chaetodon trifascialis TaxID=109706 RepID=UPI003995D803